MQLLSDYSIPKKSGSLRDTINNYLRHWPWFVLSVILAVSIAFIYLRYTPVRYQTTASILIKDEGNSDLSQLAMFQDLGMGRVGSVNLDNEIKVLRSRPLIERTVEDLNLNIKYFNEGRVRAYEYFENSPIRLEVLTPEEDWPMIMPSLMITPTSFSKFTITREGAGVETHTFGQKFDFEGVTYRLHGDNIKAASLDKTVRVAIQPKRRTIDSYKSRLQIAPDSRNGSIINIQLVSSTPDKAKAVIDNLIYQFNQDAIADKNQVSRNTADFIEERLQIIWEELDSVETGKVSYKEENRLVNLQEQGSLFLASAKEYNERLLTVHTELAQVEAMIGYLQSGDESSLLPANIGVADSGLVSLIQQYNQLVLERNQLLANTTESHPTVMRLTKQLASMKSNVLQSLESVKQSLEIKLKDLDKQEGLISSQLAGIPLKEKDFTNIERQQEIKQSLYLYLLQKREETSIALAVTEPKAKVVETAYTPLTPVAPKQSFILLGAVILGLVVPFGVIYSRQLLDNKIHGRDDITKHIPEANILGEIPRIRNEKSLVQRNDLTMAAESFRALRTNIQFAGLLDEKGKAFMVTSSIKGEGKTTVSVNLALTLSYTGLKVLLVGADIRNPKLTKFFHQDEKPDGLVNYLMNEDSSIEDYIRPSNKTKNLSIMHSGPIPPNPEEYMMMERLNTFMEEAKASYDFVILDTAPTLLVTDSLLLGKKVDATLYVVRAGHTEVDVLDFAKSLQEEGKLKNVSFILNNVSDANYGYGNGKYGYGYGYNEDKMSAWERFKNAFRR